LLIVSGFGARAIQNMLLKAYSLGLGTVCIGDIFYATELLTRHLNKPWRLVAAVALGWPASAPEPRPRKSVMKSRNSSSLDKSHLQEALTVQKRGCRVVVYLLMVLNLFI
jgi:hypothetical protein